MANIFRQVLALGLAFGCAVAICVTLSLNSSSSDKDEWSEMASELLDKSPPNPSPTNAKKSALSAAALQKLERIHVMKCAKDITGSDKPRKLAPEMRNKVLKCANDFMPPVQTKALLAASAKELISAAKTPEQKKDAQKVLAKAMGSAQVSTVKGMSKVVKPSAASIAHVAAARAQISAKSKST